MSDSINCSQSNASALLLCEEAGEHVFRLPWPVLCLLVIILLTLIGNGLVCVSVWYEPRLQNMFSFFLVSLAVGDLLDSITVMPLAIAKAYLGSFPGPREFAEAWYCFDLIFMTSSIVHICVISVDRCIGLKQPLWYCKYNTIRYIKLKIGMTWAVVVALSLPAFLLHPRDASLAYMGYQLCGRPCRVSVLVYGFMAFLLPLVVTGVALTLAIYAIYLGYKLIRTDLHFCASVADESFGTTIRETSSVIPRSRSPSFQVASLNASFKGAQRKSLSLGNFNGSFRGSKKRKGSRREHSGPGSSPKLDRHPSLRYSVRRKPLTAKDMGLALQPIEGEGADSGAAIGMALRRASIQDIRLQAGGGDAVSSFTNSPRGSFKQLTGSFRLNHRSFHGSSKNHQRGGSLRQHVEPFNSAIPETQGFNAGPANNEEAGARVSLLPAAESCGGLPGTEENDASGTVTPLLAGQEEEGEETEPEPSIAEEGPTKPDSLSLVPACSDNSILASCKKLEEGEARREAGPNGGQTTTAMTGQICRTKGSLKRHINKEGQTARVIGVMLVAYLIFHLPYFIAILVDGLCDSCAHYFPAHVVFALEWLSYSVRAVNPIIYHTLHNDFRRSFVRLLHME